MRLILYRILKNCVVRASILSLFYFLISCSYSDNLEPDNLLISKNDYQISSRQVEKLATSYMEISQFSKELDY